jgi:hypothetical protein
VTTETKQHEITPDVSIENCGTLFLFRAETQAAKEWIDSHVPADATYWCGSLAVEHRYAYDLAQGMASDGLVLQ